MIDQDDVNVYLHCMEEIKIRTGLINSFVTKQNTTGYRGSDAEFLVLQFRKVLELIALASLSANKEAYAEQHTKFAQHWNAKRILEDIGKINPDFYPVAGEQITDPDTGKAVEVKHLIHGYLTQAEFAEVYDECSKLIHASNPYGNQAELDRIEPFFSGWLTKIVTLLNHHQVQLLDKSYQLWVLMQSKDDGNSQATVMLKI